MKLPWVAGGLLLVGMMLICDAASSVSLSNKTTESCSENLGSDSCDSSASLSEGSTRLIMKEQILKSWSHIINEGADAAETDANNADTDTNKKRLKESVKVLLQKEWAAMDPHDQLELIDRDFDPIEWDKENSQQHKRLYYGFYWDELDVDHEQRHLSTLGWTQEYWDGEIDLDIDEESGFVWRPISELRPWSRLSYEQQHAASSLGFQSTTWHVLDWEGDTSFAPFKVQFDIPELAALNFEFLSTLNVTVQAVPEQEPGGDDEEFDYVYMPIKEYVHALTKENSKLYMKYDGIEQDKLSGIITQTIHEKMVAALASHSILNEIGKFGPEFTTTTDGAEVPVSHADFPTMYVGGTNSTTHVHVDLQGFTFLWVAEGRKRVVLIPNDARTTDLFPFAEEKFYTAWPNVDVLSGPLPPYAQEFILEPGEGMQLPYYAWHAVQNLEPCISYGIVRDFPITKKQKWVPDYYFDG